MGSGLRTGLKGLGLETMSYPPAGHEKGRGNPNARAALWSRGLHPEPVQQMAPGVPPARLIEALEGAPGFRSSRGCSWVLGKNWGWSTPALQLVPP